MNRRDIVAGIHDGFPVFLGYFTTAIAFGLLTRSSGFTFVEAVLTSITNYAGSGQFLMVNLYNAGSFLLEIVISVFFLNARYIFMSASLNGKMENRRGIAGRILVGSGVVDEPFAIASFKDGKLSNAYLISLSATSYTGWVSGTAVGFLVGNFLPKIVQSAAVITIYAMFSSLFGSETNKNMKAVIVVLFSGFLNSIFILLFHLSVGLSFVISMLSATLLAVFIYTDEEVLEDE